MLSLGMFNHSSDLGTGKASAFQHAMLKLFTGAKKKKNPFFLKGVRRREGGRREEGGREERLNEHLHFVPSFMNQLYSRGRGPGGQGRAHGVVKTPTDGPLRPRPGRVGSARHPPVHGEKTPPGPVPPLLLFTLSFTGRERARPSLQIAIKVH